MIILIDIIRLGAYNKYTILKGGFIMNYMSVQEASKK